MPDCKHNRLTFKTRFIVNKRGDRIFAPTGHCADCGAPAEFQPSPTLSLDGHEFQIPFVMGAPDPRNLLPNRVEVPVVVGGPRKAMN